MPASWKIALTALLFCGHAVRCPGDESFPADGGLASVPVRSSAGQRNSPSEVPDAEAGFHAGEISADVVRILSRESGWIRTSNTIAFPFEVVPSASAAAQRVSEQSAQEKSAEAAVAELFEPVHSLRARGPSSNPPSLPNAAEVDTLQRPEDLAAQYAEVSFPRYYATTGYGVRRAPRNTWRFHSYPLYYEDANLERCGVSRGCLTTACSAVHLASRVALTPYLMTLDHPASCVASLPDCPTCHKFGCDVKCPRWSLKAAAVQGAAVTGLVYVIP